MKLEEKILKAVCKKPLSRSAKENLVLIVEEGVRRFYSEQNFFSYMGSDDRDILTADDVRCLRKNLQEVCEEVCADEINYAERKAKNLEDLEELKKLKKKCEELREEVRALRVVW